MIVRLAILLLLLATSSSFAEDNSPSPLEERGRALAERMCSQCHAIGKSGQSPHVGAPPSARSIAAWILILSWSGCAKG